MAPISPNIVIDTGVMMDNMNMESLESFSIAGQWTIPEQSKEKSYWGELQYDPFKGIAQLTIHGLSFTEGGKLPSYEGAIGSLVDGKACSVFGLMTINFFMKQNTCSRIVFRVRQIVIGEKVFTASNDMRFTKYLFGCTNVKEWFDFHPLKYKPYVKYNTTLENLDFPPLITLYENDVVKIQLATGVNQDKTQTTYSARAYHYIEIRAKDDRVLPYNGYKDSMSYYESVIHNFFCLVIGKHVVVTKMIGVIDKEKNLAEKQEIDHHQETDSQEYVDFFYDRKIDKSWTKELHSPIMLLDYKAVQDNLQLIISNFFENHSKFGYVLDAWIGMRNTSSYTKYSLPRLIFNLEGLHRALFPECDTKNGYTKKIKDINAISPLKEYKKILENKNHEMHLRQRLQDIILIRTPDVFPYLTIVLKEQIIDDLCEIRNNIAHGKDVPPLDFHYTFPLILFVEEIIALLIFQQIGLELPKVYAVWQRKQEWNEVKEMLLEQLKKRIVLQ